MPCKIYSHCLGGYFIVPYSFEGSAVGRIYNKNYYQYAYSRKGGINQNIFGCREIVYRVRTVCYGSELDELNKTPDDFGEAECCYCKIVAFKAQNGKSHEIRKECGNQSRYDQGNDKRKLKTYNAVTVVSENGMPKRKRNCENGICICTEQHKTCLTERKQPCKSV